MSPSFELFDHTADMGIRVRAASMSELIRPATQGLYAVIGRLIPQGGDAGRLTIEHCGGDPALLLRDYLQELLVLFEREHRMVTAVEVPAFNATCLAVRARTALVDERRSGYDREVKAVTYHELAIRPVPGGFEATVIVDI
jgi:SHS2 domain-containing protein